MGAHRRFQLVNNVLISVRVTVDSFDFFLENDRVRVRFSSCPGLVKDSVRPRGDPPENVNGGARFASVDRPSDAGIDV